MCIFSPVIIMMVSGEIGDNSDALLVRRLLNLNHVIRINDSCFARCLVDDEVGIIILSHWYVYNLIRGFRS